MAKFLFTVWPFTGCANPQIAVARRLARRGHRVAFYTGRKFATLLEQQGFTFFPFQPALEKAVDEHILSQNAIGLNWGRPRRLRPQIREFFLDTVPLQLADMEQIGAKWAMDGMVTDPAMWAPFLILSELHRMPVAILSYACGCMLPGPDAPPMGLGLPIPRNVWTRLRNGLTGAAVDWFLSETRSGASALRRQFGLSPLDGPVIRLAAQLPLYLVPSCPEFDYRRRDLPSSVQYVGPLQWYPPQSAPTWFNELPRDRPWVHITEGTLHVRDSFLLRAAVLGLADLPIQVLLGTCDGREAADLNIGALPRNTQVVGWVNHDDLLPRTAVMVTTAGGGTVMAGMGAGVPLVTVPTEWDKAENAQRVVEAGAGIRLKPGECTPERLRSAVQTILADGAYAGNAKRIAATLARQGGPERAASLLEEMLDGSKQPVGSFAASQ